MPRVNPPTPALPHSLLLHLGAFPALSFVSQVKKQEKKHIKIHSGVEQKPQLGLIVCQRQKQQDFCTKEKKKQLGICALCREQSVQVRLDAFPKGFYETEP